MPPSRTNDIPFRRRKRSPLAPKRATARKNPERFVEIKSIRTKQQVNSAREILQSKNASPQKIEHAIGVVRVVFDRVAEEYRTHPNRNFFISFQLEKVGLNASLLKKAGIQLSDVRKLKINGWGLRWIGFTLGDFIRANTPNQYLFNCGFRYREIQSMRVRLRIRNPKGPEYPQE